MICLFILMATVWAIWKVITGNIDSVCWFSRHLWDIHDYPRDRGGDGVPEHLHEYTCWNCKKRFRI